MHFLFVAKQKKVVEAFIGTLRCLSERGHIVTLAIQEHDDRQGERLEAAIGSSRFSVVSCPEVRSDEWADVASLVRRLRDCLHYLHTPLRGAVKLRTRALSRLRADLEFDGDAATLADGILTIPTDHVHRLDRILMLAEQRLPTDPLFDHFLAQHTPNVLLLSPVVHFGPTQVDLIASATRLGIPAWMLLYSWDNLSTKGALHRWPDRMFVWNERQRAEAESLHGFPPERVAIVGAPRFDEFFSLQPAMNRDEFLAPLGLDPSKLTLLYVCSSRFVSEEELTFVRRWVAAFRASPVERLRSCNIIVRPHPDIALLPQSTVLAKHRWSALPDLAARVARPFGDARSIVLMTPNDSPRGLYESIVHSDGVVGLNTTAEIEAGIVGRPVFTILADAEDADGQATTIHFHYLRKEKGGFVTTATGLDEHLHQIDATFEKSVDPTPIHRFIESFVRPHGFNAPVSPLFAAMLESAGEAGSADISVAPPAAIDTPKLPAARTQGRRVLPLGDPGSTLHVYASSIADRRACQGVVPVDPAVVEWIDRRVGVGDILYEVGAGIGECAIVAARHKAAIVVAFEPGYAAYKELCDNVLLNRCEALVVPVPLALAAKDGLAELKYLPGQPGEPGYLVRDDINWRVKHRGATKPYLQPACLVRLDSFLENQRPPVPQHVRLATNVNVAAVLAGAIETLRLPSLKTISMQVPEAAAATLRQEFAQRDWMAEARVSGAEVHLVFWRHGS